MQPSVPVGNARLRTVLRHLEPQSEAAQQNGTCLESGGVHQACSHTTLAPTPVVAKTVAKVALAGLGAIALKKVITPVPDWHTGPDWEAFLAEYDRRMANFVTGGTTSKQVKTKFGLTQVHLCGPEDGMPLILIPGLTATATIFAKGGHVAGLGQALADAGHRVAAVDLITDLGRSIPLGVRRSPRGPEDWKRWVFEVVDGLGFTGQVDIIGYSLGAWVGAQAAALAPQRVRRYVSLAPAAVFAPIHWGFYLHSLFLFYPSQALAEWGLRKMGGDDSNLTDVASWFALGARVSRLRRYGMPGPPGVISDEMVRALPPTRLIVGEAESVTSAQVAEARIQSFPNVEAVIVPGAGHIFNSEQAKILCDAVTDFLA